jgi:three-Cys-motif partner protein
MTQLERRKSQNIVKHKILEAYLEIWGSIILMGLKSHYERARENGWPFHATFVYVDCFASLGRYASEGSSKEPTFGSPVIGIQALQKIKETANQLMGFRPDCVSILIERDTERYRDLLDTLKMVGVENRIKETTSFIDLTDGEIATVSGDFLDHADALRQFTSAQHTYSFYFVDPYGPSGIPLSIISPLIQQPHSDVMINFPWLALQRLLHPDHWDAAYGSDEWRSITGENYERELLNYYYDILQTQDEHLAIKMVPLLFPDKQRNIYYLFLTTHDATGALAINKVFDSAKLQEHNLQIEWQDERFREKSGGYVPLSMFEDLATDPVQQHASREEIADYIYEKCAHEVLEYREVLRRLANTPYYPDDVKAAMTILKRKKLARYNTLRNSERVNFV